MSNENVWFIMCNYKCYICTLLSLRRIVDAKRISRQADKVFSHLIDKVKMVCFCVSSLTGSSAPQRVLKLDYQRPPSTQPKVRQSTTQNKKYCDKRYPTHFSPKNEHFILVYIVHIHANVLNIDHSSTCFVTFSSNPSLQLPCWL